MLDIFQSLPIDVTEIPIWQHLFNSSIFIYLSILIYKINNISEF